MTNAAKNDPYDPSIYLAMAQLAASQAKYDDATSYIGSALQLKNNYTDAVYLLVADTSGAGQDGRRHHLGEIRHAN